MSAENLRHARREEVLGVLRDADAPLGVDEIAERLGVHPNTVRFHLRALTRSNRVEEVPGQHRRRGRPPTAYRPVVRMNPEGSREYRALAELLTEDLAARPDPNRRALEIGRRWGRRLADGSAHSRAPSARAATDRVRRLLDRLGFAPDPGTRSGPISLRSCPFLELAETSTRVVCPIHLGLMQGALETWEAPVTVERLEPFAEPDLCLVHLGPGLVTTGATS